MARLLPDYIRAAGVAASTARFRWDEWNVNDYFLGVDDDEFARLSALSQAANLALAIGSAEWIVHRFSLLDGDSYPGDFLEAAWAGIVHPIYCRDIETDDDEWRGPVRGALNIALSIVHDGLHRLDSDPHEATRACWMHNLASHVLPETGAYDRWLEAAIVRLLQTHPLLEDDDIWEEGPVFGAPVPREALDPARPYAPAEAPMLLDRFLSSLVPGSTRFLPTREEALLGTRFRGTPYRYLIDEQSPAGE